MHNKTYRRFKKLTLEEVLPFITPAYKNENGLYIRPVLNVGDGHTVKVFSVRLRTFKNNVRCISCGVNGAYFYVEKQRNGNASSFHLNMYGIDTSGREILMTKDHVIPKSKGGNDSLDNMQTMCIRCNQAKGNGDDKAVYCSKPKLKRSVKKRWLIKLNDFVCKTSRKKFQSNKRVEKVIGFTNNILYGNIIKQVVLTNCACPVPVASINNDPKEIELLSSRDAQNPL